MTDSAPTSAIADSSPRWRARFGRALGSPWSVSVVMAASVLLAVLGSLDRDFYALEADLILAAQLDWAEMREILAGTLKDQSPFYLWVLHFWTAIVGDGTMTIRAVSFGFGALAVLYTYLLGRAWRNHWVGLLATISTSTRVRPGCTSSTWPASPEPWPTPPGTCGAAAPGSCWAAESSPWRASTTTSWASACRPWRWGTWWGAP